MLYFAYGSMMNFREMLQRCNSAQFFAVAKLPDHSLQFTRRSISRGCGVADAVPLRGTDVWGVAYDIAEVDLEHLDRCEGFKSGRASAANSYVRQQRQVYRDGDANQPILVWIYFANPEPRPPRPNAAYKNLIVDGAKHWGLPEAYQADLAQIQVADLEEIP